MSDPQSKLKRVLELAAQEIENQEPDKNMGPGREDILAILEKRIGSLLRAGEFNSECTPLDAKIRWDAALEQALKE